MPIANDILQLSKDIGKVSERTARLEEGLGRFENKIDGFLSDLKKRDQDGLKLAKERAERDEKIDNHIGQVCQFANAGRIALKYFLPPSVFASIGSIIARYFGYI